MHENCRQDMKYRHLVDLDILFLHTTTCFPIYSNTGKPSRQSGSMEAGFPTTYPSSNAFDGVWNGLFSHTDPGEPGEVYLSVDLLSVENVVGVNVFGRLISAGKNSMRHDHVSTLVFILFF